MRIVDNLVARVRRHESLVRIAPAVAVTLAFAVAAKRLVPIVRAPLGAAGLGDVGVDFATIIYGPNLLVAEGLNPWDPINSVPRFGVFPSSPLWPSSYVFGSLFQRIGFDALLVTWMLLTVVIVVFGARRIALSFHVAPRAAWMIGVVMLLSPAFVYDVDLGQTGAGLVAITAFFAALHVPPRGRWRLVEQIGFGAVALLLVPKPTFALAAITAELAYRRRLDWCARAAAVIAVVGGACLVVIMRRADLTIGNVIESVRETSTILGDVPLQRIEGDRVDWLSLIVPSPALDLAMIIVALAVVLVIWRWRAPTTFERLFLGTIVTTLLTYHHMYDTMHLLILVLVSMVLWPGRRAWVVLAATVVASWLYRIAALDRFTSRLTDIGSFALQARLVFVVGGGLAADALLRIHRRISSGSDPP